MAKHNDENRTAQVFAQGENLPKTNIPRTIDTVVEELHELYPNEVKGILLLDGSPEYYAKDSEMKSYFINRVFAGLRTTGWLGL